MLEICENFDFGADSFESLSLPKLNNMFMNLDVFLRPFFSNLLIFSEGVKQKEGCFYSSSLELDLTCFYPGFEFIMDIKEYDIRYFIKTKNWGNFSLVELGRYVMSIYNFWFSKLRNGN